MSDPYGVCFFQQPCDLAALYAVPALRVEAFVFSFLRAPVFLHGWAPLFTVICLVGLQNAVNMADGKNGLVLGLSFVWIMCLLAYAPSHLTPLLSVLAIGLVIAAPFNWKGRLFLGDSGAYALSIAISVLVIYVYGVKFAVLPADVVALWFIVPIVDCLRLMVTRVLAGRSPFSSDRNHLHHILNDLMPWGTGSCILSVACRGSCPAGIPISGENSSLGPVHISLLLRFDFRRCARDGASPSQYPLKLFWQTLQAIELSFGFLFGSLSASHGHG